MAHLTDACTNAARALEDLSAAMATGRPDAVLAAEEPLADAVRQLLRACTSLPVEDRALAAASVRSVRVALLKCRALGRTSAALVQAASQFAPYTASGQPSQLAVRTTVESRT